MTHPTDRQILDAIREGNNTTTAMYLLFYPGCPDHRRSCTVSYLAGRLRSLEKYGFVRRTTIDPIKGKLITWEVMP